MSQLKNLYLGKAGEFLVMSHFLMRGWNVAVPEVDRGDDIFVIEDAKGISYRVQVKTANADNKLSSYSAQFKVQLAQLQKQIDPEIYYVFVVCRNLQWLHRIVIRRKDLHELYHESVVEPTTEKYVSIYFSFEKDSLSQSIKVTYSNVDISEYVENFNDFPVIQH